MKPSSTPRPTRLALTGLSLGASVLLASSLVSCANSSDSVSSQVTPAAEAQDQPNVMMILLDDLGYSDLGPYGGEVTTPSLRAPLVRNPVTAGSCGVAPTSVTTPTVTATGSPPAIPIPRLHLRKHRFPVYE